MDGNYAFYGAIIVAVLTVLGNIHVARQNNSKDRVKNEDEAEAKFQDRLMKMIDAQTAEINLIKSKANEQEKATDELRIKYHDIVREKYDIELQVKALTSKIKELEADKTNQTVKIQELEKEKEKLQARVLELETQIKNI